MRCALCSQQLGHPAQCRHPAAAGLGCCDPGLAQPEHALAESAPDDPTVRRPGQAQAWADADRLYWVHDWRAACPPRPAGSGLHQTRRTSARCWRCHTRTGLPLGVSRYPFGRPAPSKEEGTTQITIVDASGNIAAYTASVETIFGSRHLVAGAEQSAHRLRLCPHAAGAAAANRRLPPPADVVDGADTGVPGRASGAGPGRPGGRTIPTYSAGCCWLR